MGTIDWTKFARNVKSHAKDIGVGTKHPLTTREMLSRYAGEEGGPDGEDEEETDGFSLSWSQIEEFARPSDDQPTDAQRTHMVWAALLVCQRDDDAHFYESMEGDYCD